MSAAFEHGDVHGVGCCYEAERMNIHVIGKGIHDVDIEGGIVAGVGEVDGVLELGAGIDISGRGY